MFLAGEAAAGSISGLELGHRKLWERVRLFSVFWMWVCCLDGALRASFFIAGKKAVPVHRVAWKV